MLRVVVARVDHGERAGAEEVGIGAHVGERARIVLDDARDARRQLAGLAVDEIDALAELYGHGDFLCLFRRSWPGGQ